LYRAPVDWAQSSMTWTPCSRAMAVMASMSHGVPNRCVGTTALVFGVMAARNASGSSTWVRRPTSAKTGFAPVSGTMAGMAK